jgi:ferritin-like metal-binding protein YciE
MDYRRVDIVKPIPRAGGVTVQMTSLRELYVEELKDLYSAENQILKALPRMIRAASNKDLQRAFTQHERQTQQQVKRLERIFRMLDESTRGKKCKGMEGLIEEAQELIKERPEPEVLDAGLIAAAQRVEHYEIAGYGTVRTYARQLGEEEQANLLQETLNEEGETDKLLTGLAESSINIEAEQADDEGMEGGGNGSGSGRSGGTRRRAATKRTKRATARR